MRMPIISRILFTLAAVGLIVGAHVADLSPSHLFNDRWPPHAKFHTGQTLSMSVLLSLLTIFFAWRKTSDRREGWLRQPLLPQRIGSHRRQRLHIQTRHFLILNF